jgi:hypothetical protein
MPLAVLISGILDFCNVDGVVKSLIYGVVAIFHALDIPYVWSRT